MSQTGDIWPEAEYFGPNMKVLTSLWLAARASDSSVPSTHHLLTDDLDLHSRTLLLMDFPSENEVGAYFAYGGMFDWHRHTQEAEDYLGLFEPHVQRDVLRFITLIRQQPCGFFGTVEHHSIVKKQVYQRSFLSLPTVDNTGAVEYIVNLDDRADVRRPFQVTTEAERGPLPLGRTRFVEVEYLDLGFGVPSWQLPLYKMQQGIAEAS
ncbi:MULTISPECIES: hypothetical protein [Kordiimonas]|uniref:hypothetical protein n=1 Tax=Kordiimonas TaxID=288021 RepID=UPI00257C1483|nr:hypothetical protein [Kordiimonas sp. UBA4487]